MDNGHRGANDHRIMDEWCKGFGQADAAVRGGFAGLGNRAGVHADTVVGKSHPVRHGSRDVDASGWHRSARFGVANHRVSELILNPAVGVGVFVDDFFRNLEGACGGAVAFSSGSNVGPTDRAPTTRVEGALGGEIDLDLDLAGTAVVVPLIHHALRFERRFGLMGSARADGTR